MEKFNLDTWLQDKSRKVIDDDGFPVEIIKWDANEKYPVVLLNHNGIAYNVSVDGMYDADPNHGIFFADNEPYNPYKAAIESIAEMVVKYEPYCKFDIDSKVCDFFDNVKVKCKDAMEYDKMFPQEEFVSKKQYEEDLGKAYKNADKVQFNRGMSEILNNPQKYFHVGDTIRLKNSNVEHTITSIFNGRYYGERWSLDIMKAADDYELVEDCNEISDKIDYSSEIIGFLKNYIKAHGCTAMNSWVKWLENQCHDGKKWIYEDIYIKDKEQTFQDGIDEVLENPQKYGLEKQGEKQNTVTPQWMVDFLEDHRRHFGTPMGYDEQKEVDGKLLAVLNWLKGFNPQIEQKPAECSKETKNKCPNYSEGYGCSVSPLKQCDTCPDYKLYNHWKPSEEQMKHLKSISVGWHPSLDDCRILSSLYNDLLKL